MIEADALSARLGDRLVVDAVSFTVNPATVVGFLGPNGAGKSTTMRMLSGYVLPLGGEARVCGFDVVRERRAAQAKIGYLPEAAQGFADLAVGDFLRFCGEARGLRGGALLAAIDRVCTQIELEPVLCARLGELSKGWRQRAWFAQALLHDPPVLILDEPTDGLDPNQKRHVRALIRDLAPRKTILLSTHILEEAEELCSRAIVIAAGRIVADAPTASLLDDDGRLTTGFHRLTSLDTRGRPA